MRGLSLKTITRLTAKAALTTVFITTCVTSVEAQTMRFGQPAGYDYATIDLCMPEPIRRDIVAEIQSLTLNDPFDVFTGGTMVLSGGQLVIIPANMLIDLPANRLTLRQLFDDAPPACLAAGESGLAASDSCLGGASGATADILANMTSGFQVIAGHVHIEKGPGSAGAPNGHLMTGVVTHVDYTDGFVRVNGVPGIPSTGTMVRINDPESVHTVQQGPGCIAGMPNCSADVRFGLDTDNYTVAYSTGYPMCIPSTTTGGNRTVGSDAAGDGDEYCPQTNRPLDPITTTVANSTRFAPVQVGDSIDAEGNFEHVGGVTFFSAHTVTVDTPLITAEDPTQPDYLVFADVVIDAPGFSGGGLGAEISGFSTLTNTRVDINSLHKNAADGSDNEVPLASTVGNPGTICFGVKLPQQNPELCNLNQGGGIWLIEYGFSFVSGVEPGISACTNLFNAGILESSFCQITEEMAFLSPIYREVIGRSRHKAELMPGVVTLNINGVLATNGEYLTPIEVVHPDFGAIGLPDLDFPYLFTGEPWNMDRRLGPGGCVGACESLIDFPIGSLGLDPFPYSGIDPRLASPTAPIPAGGEDLMFGHWPFSPTDLLTWPPPASTLPPPVDCDDGNPCTVESCDSAIGCVYTPNDGAPCDDGDACTSGDVCNGSICEGVGAACTCATLSLSGPAALPGVGQPVDIDVTYDVAAMPLGAYAFDVSWDPAQLSLDGVVGGSEPLFGGPPLCNVDAVAGTASCTGSQIGSLIDPTGVVSVATLNLSVVATGATSVTVTTNSLVGTDSGAIAACNPAATHEFGGAMCGDVDGSGTVTISDALSAAQFQVGLRTCAEMAGYSMCDISPDTPDGACSIGDALRMAQCSVMLIPCSFTCSPLTCE